MSAKKQINYVNRDFQSIRNSLIEYSKTYFPNSYKDFNEASIGMMFIEQLAYIGDVMSFYLDSQAKENILFAAQERKNVIALAQSFGYKPRIASAASARIDFYMTVDAVNDPGANYPPNYSQTVKLRAGVVVSGGGATFTTKEPIDFTNSNKRTVMVLTASNGIPQTYMIKVSVIAESGTIKTTDIGIEERKAYDVHTIDDENVIDIVSVTDANDNQWFEVPYLAQDLIYESLPISETDPVYGADVNDAPYLLRVRSEPRRYVTRVTQDEKLQLCFGSGVSELEDVQLIPSFDVYRETAPDFLDINNFLNTRSYGLAPDSTLTVTYRTSNGFSDNVPANKITTIVSSLADFVEKGSTAKISTIACNNESAAQGAAGPETDDEIKQNAAAFFSAQGRAVSPTDYEAWSKSLPGKYGTVSKAFVVRNNNLIQLTPNEFTQLPQNAVNLFILGKDANNNLVPVNHTTKTNLITYLNDKRSVADVVNLYDTFVVNIGISFKVTAKKSYNKSQVLLDCLVQLKNMFAIDKWNIGQQIRIDDITNVLLQVNGVQTVSNITITNKTDAGYSPVRYNISANIVNNVLYPSTDPMIFEVKYPELDIKGDIA